MSILNGLDTGSRILKAGDRILGNRCERPGLEALLRRISSKPSPGKVGLYLLLLWWWLNESPGSLWLLLKGAGRGESSLLRRKTVRLETQACRLRLEVVHLLRWRLNLDRGLSQGLWVHLHRCLVLFYRIEEVDEIGVGSLVRLGFHLWLRCCLA